MKKKRSIALLVLVSLFIAVMPPADIYAADRTDINDKAVCYTPTKDYRSGDCILTATKVMIRRAAILRGSTKWKKITNKKLRKSATILGLLRHNFTYEADGLSYKIGVGTFTKTKSKKKRLNEFRALIKAHPEGIVVWGKKSSIFGMHGVLLTGVEDGIPYAMDSAYNLGTKKMGILKWDETSMKSITKCSQYWYLKEVGLAKKAKEPGKGKPLAPVSATDVDTGSTLAIRDQSVPRELKKGEGFAVKGVISSNYRLTKVKLSIIDASGRAVISREEKPGVWNFDLASIDKYIKFGTLETGTYTYKISAKDEKKSVTLVKKKFTVIPRS